MFEDEREVVIVVALPGVPAERIEVTTESGDAGRARRAAVAVRRIARARCGGSRFRTAISSGASRCPTCGSKPARANCADGCLMLRLRKTANEGHMNERRPSRTDPGQRRRGARRRRAAPEGRAPSGEGTSRPLPDDALIIVPVRNVVLFPGMVVPLTVGRERSRAARQEAVRLQRPLGVLLQSKPDAEEPGPDDLHWVGTTANVLRYITAPDGAHHAICQGVAALPRAAVPGRLSVHWSRGSS